MHLSQGGDNQDPKIEDWVLLRWLPTAQPPGLHYLKTARIPSRRFGCTVHHVLIVSLGAELDRSWIMIFFVDCRV